MRRHRALAGILGFAQFYIKKRRLLGSTEVFFGLNVFFQFCLLLFSILVTRLT